MMTYDDALGFLNAPIYSKTRPGLGPIKDLLDALGNPQDKLKFIHITGTNGKGSTAVFIERILCEAGYKTGLFTSPYIQRFTERIRISGVEISPDELASLTEEVQYAVRMMAERSMALPTTFEMITALGFLYFLNQGCDVVVLEVGLGGRLDATNIIRQSEISVITPIDYDHTDFLGSTLEEIAFEKAGIIKQNGMVVSNPQKPEVRAVLAQVAKERNAQLHLACFDTLAVTQADICGQRFNYLCYSDLKITLLGDYQIHNAITAITTVKKLRLRQLKHRITDEHIRKGLEAAKWAGRLEIVNHNPFIVVDGAHNPNGGSGLYNNLCKLFPGKKFIFIVGVMADKDYLEMLRGGINIAKRYMTITPDCIRALPGEVLSEVLRNEGAQADYFESLEDAVSLCKKAYSDEIICAFGSLYFIGNVRRICLGNNS